MDYFNSNFKDNMSGNQQDLPEGFGWEDMKDGIYEKMGTSNNPAPRKYWGLILLLLVSGCGGWLILDHFGNEKTESEQFEQVAEREGNPLDANEIKTPVTIGKSIINEESANVIVEQEVKQKTNPNVNNLKPQSEAESNSSSSTVQAISAEKMISQNVDLGTSASSISRSSQSAKTIVTNANDSNESGGEAKEVVPATAEKTMNNSTASEEILSEQFPKKDVDNKDNIKAPSIVISAEENLSETIVEEDLIETDNSKKEKQFKKHLALALAGGMNFWNAFDKTNINHQYVSGFPGYTINPSISYFINTNQSLQLDYEYTFLQELFDYDGTHAIRVPVDSAVVHQVVNGLTGQVISEDRQNVVVNGERYQKVVQYNKYKLHAISFGYNFGKQLNTKTTLGVYLGASILANINGKGKRLNEEMDVTTFDASNPIFGKSQFGIRFGVEYSLALSRNTAIMAQLMTTKYITNWELSTTNTNSRPFLYGLQLGIRQRLQK